MDSLLRHSLLSNAAFSVLTGSTALLASGPIARTRGVPDPLWIAALGPALLVFAALTGWVATRPRVDARAALAISVADLGWVLGSIGLLAVGSGSLTGAGVAVVAGVAACVDLVAMGQVLGVARLYRGDGRRGAHRSVLVAERRVAAPAEAVWPLVSDVDGYADVAPNISFSSVVAGQGGSTVRRCGDHSGGTWLERAASWDEGHRYAFDVDTAAADYPYPFRTLRGEWEVEPDGEHCVVRMRFDFTLPGGLLGDLMTATVMAPKFEPAVDAILDAWQTRAEAA